MIHIPATDSLLPQHPASNLYTLPTTSTPLIGIDWIDEAGTAYQPSAGCASTAARLHTVATTNLSAKEMAEWIDYRGIQFSHRPTELGCTTTFFTLRRYADELLDLVAEMRKEASFPEDELQLQRAKRYQRIRTNELDPSALARRIFYHALFGAEHPLSQFGQVGDMDQLTSEQVRHFFQQRYAAPTLIMSGHVDDQLVQHAATLFPAQPPLPTIQSLHPEQILPPTHVRQALDGLPQTALRIGRILPLDWNTEEYAQMLLLTTMLGGYFGSRLMSNLREEKGYTYGIYARTQLFRGVIVFYITTLVAGEMADEAEAEVRKELTRICEEPATDEELKMVKTVSVGDFLQTIDGTFERSARLGAMLQNGVDERLTEWQRLTIESTTPQQLLSVAQRWLQPESMTYCRAGA